MGHDGYATLLKWTCLESSLPFLGLGSAHEICLKHLFLTSFSLSTLKSFIRFFYFIEIKQVIQCKMGALPAWNTGLTYKTPRDYRQSNYWKIVKCYSLVWKSIKKWAIWYVIFLIIAIHEYMKCRYGLAYLLFRKFSVVHFVICFSVWICEGGRSLNPFLAYWKVCLF